jgi:hypothetical protein
LPSALMFNQRPNAFPLDFMIVSNKDSQWTHLR